VKALRKDRMNETQFTTKIDDFLNFKALPNLCKQRIRTIDLSRKYGKHSTITLRLVIPEMRFFLNLQKMYVSIQGVEQEGKGNNKVD
jgi:hypothetical protein